MEKEKTESILEAKWQKNVDSDPHLYNAFLLIHSDKEKMHWKFAAGETGGIPASPDQPYHTASLGKTFTAVLVAILMEQDKLNFKDPISRYLPAKLLKDLHTYKGTDYTHAITIDHLLSHTSGLADFYEDKPKEGKPFFDLLMEEPARFWKPQETIEWSKENLAPLFPPGKKCHYTDTGYNLLGLIIENITGRPYHQVLHELIFHPLEMNDSYLSHYSKPARKTALQVAHLDARGKEVDCEAYVSFSSIYSGGQTISTSEDLLVFMRALKGNKMVREETLARMMEWNKLWMGVDYGKGLMRVRMMPLTEKYHVWGHLGSIGSFMMYNPSQDVYLIVNFNKIGYTGKSIRFVYQALRAIARQPDKQVPEPV